MSDTSGPAFPQPMFESPNDGFIAPESYGYGGMTLRDYFAAAALQGMCSCQDFVNEVAKCSSSKTEVRQQIAGWAYKFADEMLVAKAREAM